MVRFSLQDYGQTDWDALTNQFDGASLLQSWSWGAAKAKTGPWRVERGVLRDERDQAVGAVQVLIRQMPVIGGGLAWIARGPLYVPGEGARYPALLAALRRHYVDGRGLHLRIAPALPASRSQEDLCAAAGFRPAGARGWISAVVDLSLPAEALRRGLAQKWRNGLNKAERLGVTVESVPLGPAFTAFLMEYGTFLAQRGFSTSVTPDLLATLQEQLPRSRKMMAWRSAQSGTLLSGALIAPYGDHAEYLVGFLSDAGRQCSAGQLILWHALLAEKERGARWFDVGGMDPALTPKGILDFKAGLGGALYRLADEIEADDSGFRARLVRWRIARARAATGAAA